MALSGLLFHGLACHAPNPLYQYGGDLFPEDAGAGRPDVGAGPGDARPVVDARAADGSASVDAAAPVVRLAALWRFDETAGGTAEDASGGGSPGVLENLEPAQAWGPGRQGGALALPDVPARGGVKVVPSARLEEVRGPMTISAWINPRPGAAITAIVSRQYGAGNDDAFWLGLVSGQLQFDISAKGAATFVRTQAKPPQNAWSHVAVVFTPALVSLYLDGALRATGVPDVARLESTPHPLYVGNNKNGPGPEESFVGRLDEVAIFDGALAATEIARLAQGTSPLDLR
jgi:hypothetical protein